MMARYYSFPTLEQMWQAEIRIGESEIALELMGFNVVHGGREHHHLQRRRDGHVRALSKEVRAPASSSSSPATLRETSPTRRRCSRRSYAEAEGESLKSVEDPETEGILLAQCTRISASIRETFRPGGYFKSNPDHGPAGPDHPLGDRRGQGQAAADREGPDSGRRRRLLRMGRRAGASGQDGDLLQVQPHEPGSVESRRHLGESRTRELSTRSTSRSQWPRKRRSKAG